MECAVRSDGSEPAKTFLAELKRGMWREDAEAETFPHDEQIEDYYRFLDLISELAEHGCFARENDYNYLDQGVWELKVYTKRLSFFDTDGSGADNPKPKITDITLADTDDETWRFPSMDRLIRLGFAFPKLGDKTEPDFLREAVNTRKEDLARDKP